MLIIPIDQAQAIYDAQPLRQPALAEAEPQWTVPEYQVLQEDDGEID